MKYLSYLIIFTLLFGSMQAFAEEKPKEMSSAVSENEENTKEKISVLEKIKNIEPTKIKIYDFNPIKNPKGVITIVEFNDLSCKECLVKANNFYSELSQDSLKNIKIIYKHINSNKTNLVNQPTVYALVAANLGKFWEFKDVLTKNNLETNEQIIEAMTSIGIKKQDLYDNLMMKSDKFYKNIDADEKFAKYLKNTSAPMFYVDGYKVDEDINKEELIEYITLRNQEFLKARELENNKYKMGKF